jgi:hypothetical protein
VGKSEDPANPCVQARHLVGEAVDRFETLAKWYADTTKALAVAGRPGRDAPECAAERSEAPAAVPVDPCDPALSA